MFKISFYIKKKHNVSIEDFREYWLGEHARLVKAYASRLGVRQYLKCEVLPEHPLTKQATATYETGPLRYDFIDHWIFNDIEDLRRGAQLADVQAMMTNAYESEDLWVDIGASNVLMTTDLVQFYPGNAPEIRATPGGDYLKIYYPVRIFPHLNRQQTQLHWNACHGGESRDHIKYSMQKKYIQAHAIDSTFVDELCALRGYEVDPTFIGHAEGWYEVEPTPPPYPEEECAEIVSMTLDDIDLFADKARGSVFFALEHYIIDEKVVTRPNPEISDLKMPAFFSAVY